MARLILLNGPPAIGKSTLARRFVDDHPLALNLDIDVLRTWLGRWEQHDEAKGIARTLALGLAQEHLVSGHDVVVPQLLARIDQIERFERAASSSGAEFVEIIILGPDEQAMDRFHQRRAQLAAGNTQHPEATIAPGKEAENVRFAYAEIREVAAARAGATVLESFANKIDDAYDGLLRLLGERP
jgi:predicted kinase